MYNDLDPDQEPLTVGPDLGLNCSQRLSADDGIRLMTSKVLNVIRANTRENGPYHALFRNFFQIRMHADAEQAKGPKAYGLLGMCTRARP